MKHLQYKKRAKEQGVALIFALGILSLLLITALAFAMNSLMAQKEAKNNLNQNSSITLANATCERIIATLKYMNANGRLDQSKYLVSRNNTNIHKVSHADRIGAGYTDTNMLNAYYNYQDYTPNDYLPSAITPQWEYILDSYTSSGTSNNVDGTTSDTGTTSKIIGRIAYWTLPEYGTVNLSEVILGNAPTLDTPYTASTDKYDTNNRFGRSIRELDITGDSTNLPYGTTSDLLNQIYNATNSSTDKKITNILDVLNVIEPTDDQRQWITETFSPAGQNEPEIYYYDPNGDGSFERRQYFQQYHRFNLNNSRWNYGLSINSDTANANTDDAIQRLFSNDVGFNTDGAKEAKSGSGGLVINVYENGNATASAKYVGLPFLRMVGNSAGAYSDIQTRRKQIGANLLDYCDENDIPTSDVSASSWSSDPSSTAPTYTGNEKTPYINELAFDIVVTAAREDLETIQEDETNIITDSKLTFSAYIDNLDIELFDIYKYDTTTPRSGSFTLSFSGTVNMELSSTSFENTEDMCITFDHSVSHSIENISSRYIKAENITTNLPVLNTDSDSTDGTEDTDNTCIVVTIPNMNGQNNPEGTITLKSVNITHVVLKYNDNAIDFVKALDGDETDSGDNTLTLTPTTTNTTSLPLKKKFDVAFSVDDPRENLYQSTGVEDNWAYYRKNHANETSESEIRTIGGKNTNCIPNTNATYGDIDTLTHDANLDTYAISTGFIRNDDMLSPMELGAIHRGRKWQTINLKKAEKGVDPSSYKLYTSSTYGEDVAENCISYDDGDGAILNHIKMSADIYSPGKVNLNSQSTMTGDWAKYIHAFLLQGVIAKSATYDLENETSTENLASNKITLSAAKGFAEKLNTIINNQKIASRTELISSRGSNLYEALGQISLSSTPTDAEQEAIAGKIMHLLSTEEIVSTQYKFVVVVQTIRDMGGIDLTKTYLASDGDYKTIDISTEFGTFDIDTSVTDYSIDKAKGTPVYGDEITGEVKLLVTIDFDTSANTAKIISFELID